MTVGSWRLAPRGGHDRPAAIVDHLERDERQAQRVGDGVHDRREGALRIGSQLEALPEPPDRPPRLVPLAVQEPVDAALQAVAERQGDEGGDAGREQRDARTRAPHPRAR